MRHQPIKGFEGLYSITEDGRVISLRNNRELKPKIDRYGYKTVVLSNHGYHRYFTIHRLVALAFLPRVEGKNCVNHIDENKLNNNVSNLEWVNPCENANHGTRNQRMSETKCTRPVCCVDNNGNVFTFKGVKDASRQTGLAHSVITNLCKNNRIRNGLEWRFCI